MQSLRLQHVARALSLAAHPLPLMALLLLALAAPGLATLRTGAALVLALGGMGAALTLFMHRQVRRGAWEHVDASRPEERPALFRFILLLFAAGLAAALHLRPQALWLVHGLGGAMLLIACAYALLRWTKLSLHLAFAAYAAALLLARLPALALLLVLLLPALAWSRVYLRRHRVSETLVGAVLGLGVGLGIAGL